MADNVMLVTLADGRKGALKLDDTGETYGTDPVYAVAVTAAGSGSSSTQVQGTAAAGAVPAGNPVLLGVSDGTNVRIMRGDSSGRPSVRVEDGQNVTLGAKNDPVNVNPNSITTSIVSDLRGVMSFVNAVWTSLGQTTTTYIAGESDTGGVIASVKGVIYHVKAVVTAVQAVSTSILAGTRPFRSGAVVDITTSGANYASGDVVGSEVFSAAVDIGQGATLDSLTVLDNNANAVALDIYFFPDILGGTYTDNAALSWNTADFNSCLGAVAVQAGDYISNGSKSIATLRNLGLPVSGFADLYFLVIAKGAATFTNGNLKLSFGFRQT